MAAPRAAARASPRAAASTVGRVSGAPGPPARGPRSACGWSRSGTIVGPTPRLMIIVPSAESAAADRSGPGAPSRRGTRAVRSVDPGPPGTASPAPPEPEPEPAPEPYEGGTRGSAPPIGRPGWKDAAGGGGPAGRNASAGGGGPTGAPRRGRPAPAPSARGPPAPAAPAPGPRGSRGSPSWVASSSAGATWVTSDSGQPPSPSRPSPPRPSFTAPSPAVPVGRRLPPDRTRAVSSRRRIVACFARRAAVRVRSPPGRTCRIGDAASGRPPVDSP